MKRTLVLLVALFMCGVAVSQENEKKFTLSIQENLLPVGDFAHEPDDYYDILAFDKLQFLNWLPSFELDYDNKFSARLRFNVLHADKGHPAPSGALPHYYWEYFNHHIATSTSITLGYNLLNKSKAHRLKVSAVLGAVYLYKDYYAAMIWENGSWVSGPTEYIFLPNEKSWHFQIGAELAYQYFLPCTNYRLGFGASYELSYSNYNPQQTIGLLNLNVSWKLFNF